MDRSPNTCELPKLNKEDRKTVNNTINSENEEAI